MKLKEGFVVREVAGQTVVLPSGENLNLNINLSLLTSALVSGATEIFNKR